MQLHSMVSMMRTKISFSKTVGGEIGASMGTAELVINISKITQVKLG